MSFLGGWILTRDRKKNYVGPRFREKQKSSSRLLRKVILNFK